MRFLHCMRLVGPILGPLLPVGGPGLQVQAISVVPLLISFDIPQHVHHCYWVCRGTIGQCNSEGYMVGSPCSQKNELSWPTPCERASKTDLVSLFDFEPGTSP